jgi:hypothetical protein
MCLIGQAASGFVMMPNTALVILSGCDSGYLVKDCGNEATITKVKDYSVNLKESIKMDSGDKKQDTKEKKPVAKKVVKSSKYKSCDKYKDNSKKYSACKKSVDKKLLKQQSQKTKHDTVKNSIGNIR